MASLYELDSTIQTRGIRRPDLVIPEYGTRRLSRVLQEKLGKYERYKRELPISQDKFRRVGPVEFSENEYGFQVASFETHKKGKWQLMKQIEENPIPIRSLTPEDRRDIFSKLEPCQDIRVLAGMRNSAHERAVLGLGENMDVFGDLMERCGARFGRDHEGYEAYFLETSLNMLRRGETSGPVLPNATPDLVLMGSHLASIEVGSIYMMGDDHKNDQWADQSRGLQMMFPRVPVTGFLAFYDRKEIEGEQPLNTILIYDRPVQAADKLLHSTMQA